MLIVLWDPLSHWAMKRRRRPDRSNPMGANVDRTLGLCRQETASRGASTDREPPARCFRPGKAAVILDIVVLIIYE